MDLFHIVSIGHGAMLGYVFLSFGNVRLQERMLIVCNPAFFARKCSVTASPYHHNLRDAMLT